MISRHKKSPNNILHNKKFAKLGTNKQVGGGGELVGGEDKWQGHKWIKVRRGREGEESFNPVSPLTASAPPYFIAKTLSWQGERCTIEQRVSKGKV